MKYFDEGRTLRARLISTGTRERAAFADNSVKYEATLRFINSSVRTMLDAIKSPSQG